MIKSIICCLMCIILFIIPLTGCQKEAPVPEKTPFPSQHDPNNSYSPATPSAFLPTITPEISPTITPEAQPTPNIPVPEPNKVKPLSITDIGEVIYARDLGIDGISSYLYWVPGKNAVFFQGYHKDTEGKFTPGVYYYENEGQEITTILMGSPGSNYVLGEPVWSSYNNEVLFSFSGFSNEELNLYIYNFQQSNLELLPISGRQAEFSPDGSKIIYVDKNQNLQLYNRSDQKTQTLGSDIKGHSPIWFSDNRHILFFKNTGKNPHKLDGADLHVICLFDTLSFKSIRIIGDETVYRDLHWALQDSIAWIDSGWDDGHFVGTLDLSSNRIGDLGEADFSKYLTGREPRLIKHVDKNQWNVYDIQQNHYIEYLSCPDQGKPLGLLPDNTLLFWQTDNDKSSSLIAMPHYEDALILAQDTNLLYPVVSDDSTRFAFIDSNGYYFVLTDSMMIFKSIIEETVIPRSETEYMNSLIQAINDENIDELATSCYSVYGTLQPEEVKSLPQGLKYFKHHFNNEKIVDFICADKIRGRYYSNPYINGIHYFLISESGIWREIEILRNIEGSDLNYQFNEQLFNFASSINKRALDWFDIVKTGTVPSLYDYFSWLSEGDFPPYSEGTDPNVLERVNRALNRYKKAFKLDSLEFEFTGFSTRQYGSLRMVYELSGLSLEGIPLRHYVDTIYDFPECGVYDLWLK